MFSRCVKVVQILLCVKFALCCFCQNREIDSSWIAEDNRYKGDVDSSYATFNYYRDLEENWRTRRHITHDARREMSRRFTKRLLKFYGHNTKRKLKKDYAYLYKDKPSKEEANGQKKASRALASEEAQAQEKYESKTERIRFNVKPRLFKGYVVMEVKNHFFEVEGVVGFDGNHEIAFYKPSHEYGFVSCLEYKTNDDQITAKVHKPLNENWSMEVYQSFANSGGDPDIPGRDTGLQIRYAVDF